MTTSEIAHFIASAIADDVVQDESNHKFAAATAATGLEYLRAQNRDAARMLASDIISSLARNPEFCQQFLVSFAVCLIDRLPDSQTAQGSQNGHMMDNGN